MSITDELRKHARGEAPHYEMAALLEIADRIDAEHERACDDAWNNGYEADYLGIEKWLVEHPQVMEHHNWIRLPCDADGVPWEKLRDDAKRLMEGAIVLWEQMVEESE